MGVICNNTRSNHYREEDTQIYPSIYDVQIELFGKESKIVSYKQLSHAK